MTLMHFPLSGFKLPDYIDRVHLQGILNNIKSKQANSLDDIEWVFTDVKIDFSIIKSLEKTYPFYDLKRIISPTWLAKILFLASIDGKHNATLIRATFDSIAKTFFYLAENRRQYITKKNLHEYVVYMLMNGVSNGRVSNRLTPVCYKYYRLGIASSEWLNIIKEYSLPKIGFSEFESIKTIEKELKNAIETLSAGNLTFRDWKDGGSFNLLTLEYGRYYVEHCVEFFNKNINIAIALRNTVENSGSIAKMAGFKINEDYLYSGIGPAIIQFLMGKEVDDLKPHYKKKYSADWWKNLQKCTLDYFKKELSVLSIMDKLTSEQTVIKIATEAGIETFTDFHKEWITYLVEAECTIILNKNSTKAKELASLEIESIRKVVGQTIDVDNIIIGIKEEINYVLSSEISSSFIPTQNFYKSNGIEENGSTSTYVHNFLRSVEDAGIILCVAFTGWRESEFGFSLNDFNIQANLDLIDQYAHPIHYEIKWIVPKTNGNTKLEREIIRSVYRCAIQLSTLVGANDNAPCLYSTNALAKDVRNSGYFIKSAVGSLWKHFVLHYTPFKQLELLEELHSLKNKAELSYFDSIRCSDLLKQYQDENWGLLDQDVKLKEAHQRAKDEFDRVSFFLNFDRRRGFIWKYKEGTLNKEHTALVDQYLSEETKSTILALNSEDEVNQEFTSAVMNEILGDCLYPTPHAFRHMWAEAVYLRFDGDVGWMIRSNFKHISPNMWLAYIRNKNNGHQNERVKRKVASALLRNYIRKREVDNEGNVGEFGNDYAGAMNSMLRRLFRNTKTWTIDELDKAIDHFALTEIEDIKSNPWGFCILKKRHQNHAKCAELGVPQRQNASPAFCLGCQNNLTQSGNIDGILLGISNDTKVLTNPKIPHIYQRASYTTVKNALVHLKKLKADEAFILKIENVLEGAKHVLRTA